MSFFNPDQSVFIIAEAGVNHDGEMKKAMELIEVAKSAGADAIKFQTFTPALLVTCKAELAAYQKMNVAGEESQFEMLERLALREDDFRKLKIQSEKSGLTFMSTAFDSPSLLFLSNKLDLSVLKIPSGEITNGPLLLEYGQANKNIILSTGMCSLREVWQALSVLAFGLLGHENPSTDNFRSAFESEAGQKKLRSKVTLLHCTTQYPATYESVNLRAMATLKEHFGLRVGYSDHTPDIAVSIAAVAAGASVIEKHVTLDNRLPGPDHAASLLPDQFVRMVEGIRSVEKSLGDGQKVPHPTELENLEVARKSLIANQPIAKGEKFSADNIIAKRPGKGRSPMEFWDLLGEVAAKDYNIDEFI